MNTRDAKALGRWCGKHRRQFGRVHLANGAAVTGCPDCIAEPEFASALDALIEAARAMEVPR